MEVYFSSLLNEAEWDLSYSLLTLVKQCLEPRGLVCRLFFVALLFTSPVEAVVYTLINGHLNTLKQDEELTLIKGDTYHQCSHLCCVFSFIQIKSCQRHNSQAVAHPVGLFAVLYLICFNLPPPASCPLLLQHREARAALLDVVLKGVCI